MDFDLSTIVGIAVVLVILVLLFTTRKSKVEEEATPAAPYKVETPVVPTVTETVTITEPKKCGCGRSQSGLCVGLHALSPAEWAVHADNPNKAESKPAKKAPAKKAPAKKAKAADKAPEKPVDQPVEKKPAAKKTRVKKSA